MLNPRAHLSKLAPYAIPDRPSSVDADALFLDQNESYEPLHSDIIAAAVSACGTPHIYPDADASLLREAIGNLHNIDSRHIICARGAMELISLLATAYLEPDCNAISSEFGYLYFSTATALSGADLVVAPEPDLIVDTDVIPSLVTPQTRIVFIANPGNPSGSYLQKSKITALRSALPDDVLLILDEAYGELVSADRYEPCFDLVESSNTVVLRTFSKIYGLAGLRAGWGYFPPHIEKVIRTIQQPNGLNHPAQAAALAAIHSQHAVTQLAENLRAVRNEFIQTTEAIGFGPVPSETNFVLLRFKSLETANKINEHLLQNKIHVRTLAAYNLNHCLRITLGSPGQMRRLVKCLTNFKSDSKNTGTY